MKPLLHYHSDFKRSCLFSTIGVVLLFVWGCTKDESPTPQPPLEVITLHVSEITTTTVRCHGRITSQGDNPILQKGICWSDSPTPLITDHVSLDTTISNEITAYISDLLVYSKYYFRAFATSQEETIYGQEQSFTTQGGMITDIDGNVYHTISIGSQVWLLENLETTRYRNGDSILFVSDNAEWQLAGDAYCYYDNDPSQKSVYGCLYNWLAVDDSRLLAPEGWHIPTKEEWDILSLYAGSGGNLKETGMSHWFSPNTDATNTTGFTGLPAGYRSSIGTFSSYREKAFFWTGSVFVDIWGNRGGEYRFLSHNDSIIGSHQLAARYGCSVRCIKD